MSEEQNRADCCPDLEVLSAWIDQEITLPEPVLKHVETCPLCKKNSSELRNVSRKISNGLNEQQTPSKLNEKILKEIQKIRCNKTAHINPLPTGAFSRRQWALRIVAVLIFAAAFIWLFCHNLASSKKMENKQIVRQSALPKREIRNSSFKSYRKSAKYVSYQTDSATTYTNNPLEINGNGTIFGVFDNVNDNNLKFQLHLPHQIPGNLSQFWYTDTFQTFEVHKFLMSLARLLQVPSATFVLTQEKNFVNVTAKMTARQTVLFAKQIKHWGVKQLSDAHAIQNENFFQGNGDEVISYDATIYCIGTGAANSFFMY